MIAPNDSFTARLTHPRAGTFIYHTHLNDEEQLTSGAYGPLIVLDPGEKWNTATDHVFTLGRDRSVRPGRMVVNGDSTTSVPLELKLGKTHRFRFVNITPANGITFALRRDSLPVTWRPRAKDGADLPEAMRAAGPALRSLALGETFDAEWTPTKPGVFAMTAGGRSQWFYSRSVIVR
jgi:FtsP/CotA-like multicopper oxidase with cupredoxin domain